MNAHRNGFRGGSLGVGAEIEHFVSRWLRPEQAS